MIYLLIVLVYFYDRLKDVFSLIPGFIFINILLTVAISIFALIVGWGGPCEEIPFFSRRPDMWAMYLYYLFLNLKVLAAVIFIYFAVPSRRCLKIIAGLIAANLVIKSSMLKKRISGFLKDL